MVILLSGIMVYLVFFLLLPLSGAILVRRRWRIFRSRVVDMMELPFLEYGDIRSNRSGFYKLYARLEALKGDDEIWLKNESVSVCTNLKKSDIYLLSREDMEDTLVKTSWSELSTIVEGSHFFISGCLKKERGIPFLAPKEDKNLLVIIYDEGREDLTERIIKEGRQKNELWNTLTPYAYIIGVLSLIILSFISYKSSVSKIDSYLLLVAAGTPFYFVLPPGLFFYMIYRKKWQNARKFRELRDLFFLKKRVEISLACVRKARNNEVLALLLFILGYLLNVSIASVIIFKMYLFLLGT